MKVRGVRLALIVSVSAVCLVVGVLVLRSGATPSLADGPNLSVAGAWPPIPTNLSRSATRYSKVADVEANANGILVAWSEGETSPNGEVWMQWNNKSGWNKLRVDDQGGYTAFSPSAVLVGTTAHFVWVGKTSNQYAIFYRSRNLAAGTWSLTQQVYPPSGDELGNAQIAVDSTGKRHVIWTLKSVVNPGYPTDVRDRIYYSYWTGSVWSAEERISGYRLDISPDGIDLSQDMPAIVANGTDVYVAWREKSAGDRGGIWVRHRDPDITTEYKWVPGNVAEGEVTMGYQIGYENLDEFPALAAAGDRLYATWDRYVGVDCDIPEIICNNVYSMPYRVHTEGDIIASWWPTVTAEPAGMVLGDDTPITALSAVTTADGQLDRDFGAVIPDDYYSGARPQIGVIEASGVYTPYVVWHHWSNEAWLDDDVTAKAPYHVFYSYVSEGDLETAYWEDREFIWGTGANSIFASPAMVLAPGIDSPHSLHVALNVRMKADPAPWDVLYTNLGQYYWGYLPLVFKSY